MTWLTNEDGKRRLRVEIAGIRVSTREDSPTSYLTSIKLADAPQHEGYSDIATTTSEAEAVAMHCAIASTIGTLVGMGWVRR